jgi:hypothetical protein
MKVGVFRDEWRGNGVFASAGQWLVALRWRWHFHFVRPPARPGYTRLYIGPLEVEHRKAGNREQPPGASMLSLNPPTKPDK